MKAKLVSEGLEMLKSKDKEDILADFKIKAKDDPISPEYWIAVVEELSNLMNTYVKISEYSINSKIRLIAFMFDEFELIIDYNWLYEGTEVRPAANANLQMTQEPYEEAFDYLGIVNIWNDPKRYAKDLVEVIENLKKEMFE